MNQQARREVFRNAMAFESLNEKALDEIAGLASTATFARNEIVFQQNAPCDFFYVVAEGLVKVSIYAESGLRLTYLLAGMGEPLNLVGPFTGKPRHFIAEAMQDTVVLTVAREKFIRFAFQHPDLVINIIGILGQALDSANSRIMDMVEKRVQQRVLRVLHTLYSKFGPRLKFTSAEIAELAGTTTESTLRTVANLRKLGYLRSSRGEITIKKPHALHATDDEVMWV